MTGVVLPWQKGRLAAAPAQIEAFLRESVHDAIHLVAIVPDGPPAGRWFGDDVAAATGWAADRNRGGANVYWTVNAVRPDVHKKATKADVELARFAHVDVDPPKEGEWDKAAALADIMSVRGAEPSFVIDSGGGLQAFWRLNDGSIRFHDIEAINMGLRDRFGGDACWNIDRLMRLPGTINYPDARKRERGRVPALAAMAEADAGICHDPLTLAHRYRPPPAREKPVERGQAQRGSGPHLTADDLDLGDYDPIRATIVYPPGRDRSDDALACAGALLRAGFSEAQVEGVLLNPANPVSAHCLSQANPVRAAWRCIERVRGDAPAADAPAMLPLIDPAAWADHDAPARVWALYEMILVGQVTYLTGAGATGKSLLGQQLATCIATNNQFLGMDVREGVALYLTCEDDPDELHRRQKAICASMGVPLADLSGRLHLASLAGAIGNELATFDAQGRMAFAPAWHRLRETVLAIGATFVVLDNVAHLFAGGENIRQQVASFLSLLNGLAQESGAAILLIGHPNKSGDSYSGSTAWENQVRSRLFLDRPRDPDGSVLDPDARVLSRGKANYSRNGDAVAFRWHQWAFIRDEDLPEDTRAQLDELIRANAEDERFMRCLDKATLEKRATSPNRTASNYAPRLFASMPTGRGIGEKGFEAAMQRLLHNGTIANGERVYQRDNRAWVTGIGRAPTLAPTPAPTLAQECTNPPAQGEESCTDLHALTPLYTTYNPGAAPEGSAAPSSEKE